MDFPLLAHPFRPRPSLDRWTDKFERHARLHPARIAAISGSSCLSYGELSSRSNQIANHLRSLGVGRGQFVGLGLNRSLELPVALLGILKSGAAYVPLDPGHPAARIRQMIASAKLKYVVTHSETAGKFHGVRTICMDDAAATHVPSTAFSQAIEHDDLVYAIFASASAKPPMAASVSHRELGNLLHWYSIELTLGPADRTLIISSPSFDLTRKNFFAPLVTGGTLILDDCQSFDITRIGALIRDHGVTLINCTPSAFYPLLDATAMEGYTALSSLRFAVLDGEPISINRLRLWLEHPACRAEVVNTFAPAECADFCAFHRLHRGNLDGYSTVTSGREIQKNKRAMIDHLPAATGKYGFVGTFPSDSNDTANCPDESSTPTVPAGTSLESKILALWSEVLDRPVNDGTTNFFDIGGNTIHIAIIHVRLMEMTGRIFPITELFALPNARSMAEFLSTTGAIVAVNSTPHVPGHNPGLTDSANPPANDLPRPIPRSHC
jgi:acyl-CoA synthetase (AMP-forming)/AMP-acid ligase II